MEPMTIGSPISHSPSPTAPFLPSFLMGAEPMSPSSSKIWSTPKTSAIGSPASSGLLNAKHSLLLSSPSSTSNTGSLIQTPGRFDSGGRQSARPSPYSQSAGRNHPKDSKNGPPTLGLYQDPPSSPNKSKTNSPYLGSHISLHDDSLKVDATGEYGTPHATSRSQLTVDYSPSSQDGHSLSHGWHAANQSRYSPRIMEKSQQGDLRVSFSEQHDDLWVTVFGFPPSAAEFILQQFSMYGDIVKHSILPNGNWIHLKYATKLQSRKALSKNGKIFGNNIMIGVQHCIDKNVTQGTMDDFQGTVFTPTGESVSQLNSSNVTSRTPIRPLAAAYKSTRNELEVLNDANTPKKDSNIISKTLEYVFGW